MLHSPIPDTKELREQILHRYAHETISVERRPALRRGHPIPLRGQRANFFELFSLQLPNFVN